MSVPTWLKLPNRAITPDQAIALTGVIAPLLMIDELSQTGHLDAQDFSAAMLPLFVFEPEDTRSVFAKLNLNAAKRQLLEILRYQPTNRNRRLLRYLVTLFKIERKLSKDENALDIIRRRLLSISDYYDSVDLDESRAISELATTYKDTLSKYPERVEVQGRSTYLKQEKVAAHIRCLLLSSVRALVLWRQLGGSRSHFLLSRNALIKEVEVFNA